MAQPPQFDVPQQLRELTEKNLETARAAYTQWMDAMTKGIGLWASAVPANDMTSNFKAVQDRAIRFAKQNGESYFQLASELASAKDMQDALAIQARFAQVQMQTFALQSQEITRLMAEAAQSMTPKR